jgi:hypothetical protein
MESCQLGIRSGTKIDPAVYATTSGADRAPLRATTRIVRYTHRTNPVARAYGSSATKSSTMAP